MASVEPNHIMGVCVCFAPAESRGTAPDHGRSPETFRPAKKKANFSTFYVIIYKLFTITGVQHYNKSTIQHVYFVILYGSAKNSSHSHLRSSAVATSRPLHVENVGLRTSWEAYELKCGGSCPRVYSYVPVFLIGTLVHSPRSLNCVTVQFTHYFHQLVVLTLRLKVQLVKFTTKLSSNANAPTINIKQNDIFRLALTDDNTNPSSDLCALYPKILCVSSQKMQNLARVWSLELNTKFSRQRRTVSLPQLSYLLVAFLRTISSFSNVRTQTYTAATPCSKLSQAYKVNAKIQAYLVSAVTERKVIFLVTKLWPSDNTKTQKDNRVLLFNDKTKTFHQGSRIACY